MSRAHRLRRRRRQRQVTTDFGDTELIDKASRRRSAADENPYYTTTVIPKRRRCSGVQATRPAASSARVAMLTVFLRRFLFEINRLNHNVRAPRNVWLRDALRVYRSYCGKISCASS